MSSPTERKRFTHPVPFNEITEENYRDIADDLFFAQVDYGIEYLLQIKNHGYGDDDTDYLRTYLDAQGTLMDIAYDGSLTDLRDFLFLPRTTYDKIVAKWQEFHVKQPPLHMPLHAIDSAGGLCNELQTYINQIEEEEE